MPGDRAPEKDTYQECMESQASLDRTVVVQRNRGTMKSAEGIDLEDSFSKVHLPPSESLRRTSLIARDLLP